MGRSRAAFTATTLAVSIELPPPRPITQSWSSSRRKSVAASTEVTVGSGTTPVKARGCNPAAVRIVSTRSSTPDDAIHPSVTISGRDRPNWASASGNSSSVPAPIRIARGR